MTSQQRQLKEIEKLMGLADDQPQVIVQVNFVNPIDRSVTAGPRFVVGGGREINEESQS